MRNAIHVRERRATRRERINKRRVANHLRERVILLDHDHNVIPSRRRGERGGSNR